MNEELLIIQLRDCFTAGYTMPQFCIDNDIKKPLFTAYDISRVSLLWEIFIQFKYDKRIIPQFAFVKGQAKGVEFAVKGITQPLQVKNISEIDFSEVDKNIAFTFGKRSYENEPIIFLDELLNYFINRTYAEIPLLHFLQQNPKVKLICTSIPQINWNYLSAFEAEVVQKTIWDTAEELSKNPDTPIKTPYDFLGYSNKQVYDLLSLSKDAKQNLDGSTRLNDNDNPLVNIRNGKRITPNQPKNFKNTIYFMGTCTFFGIGAPCDKTVEGYLQKMLNENHLPYRVENASQFYCNRYQDIFYNLKNLPLKPNDIVFICLYFLRANSLPFFDLLHLFDRPHNYGEVFADSSSHVNEIGYKVIAEKFFELLVQNNFFQDTDFKYPMPPPRIIDMGYRKKIFQPRKSFSKTKKWKNIKKNFAQKKFQ